MKNCKGNEFGKVVVASVLSIGVFSMAFIGINNLVFAAATDKTESIPPVAASFNVAATKSILPKGYQEPKITVYEDANESNYVKSANALTPEESAEIGAQYIWEVLGENIDGKTVEMYYSGHPSSTKAYWSGTVADSKTQLENHEALFRFTIDAVSGERIGISQDLDKRPDDIKTEQMITFEEIDSLSNEVPDQIEEYTQIVREYAQKHFNKSKVANVVYDGMNVRATGKDLEKKAITFKEKTLLFKVTDETGREASIIVTMETKQLFDLDTSYNDIVPGFNADILPGAVG